MKRIQVAIISIFLLLTYTSPTFAACPEGTSKDPTRLAKYYSVINGYINEIRNAIKSTGDGGKEHVAEILLSVPEPVGDFIANPYASRSREFQDFLNKIAEIKRIFDLTYNRLSPYNTTNPLRPSGSLAWNEMHSIILKFHEMYSTVYPKEDPDEDGKYYRNTTAQQDAKTLLDAYLKRNNDLVTALDNYLVAMDKYFQTALSLKSGKAAPEIFELAKRGAQFTHDLTTSAGIPKNRIVLAQSQYLVDHAIYHAYAKYYSSLASSYQSALGTTVVLGCPVYPYGWQENICQSIQPIDWNVFTYTYNLVEHNWDFVTQTFTTEDPVYSGIYIVGFGEVAKGNFSINSIKNFWLTALQSNEDLTAAAKETLAAADANSYIPHNTFYSGVISARQTLLNEVNAALDTYKLTIPYSVPYKLTPEILVPADIPGIPNDKMPQCKKVDIPGLIAPTYKTGPITVSITLTNPPDKKYMFELPFNFSGKATSGSGTAMTYRWVITSIPDTEEAKSLNFVLYQKISTGTAAVLYPDLDNGWSIAFEVFDAQTYNMADISVEAVRQILWIAHKDTEIVLELEPMGLFYLEVAKEKAAIYSNYNDDGKPVDLDSRYLAPGKCFTINKSSATNAEGAYDGKHSSTLLPLKFTSPRNFDLSSATKMKGYAHIDVVVDDPNITDLVVPVPDCYFSSFPLKRTASGQLLSGTYSIEQSVDYSSWWKVDGAFREMPNFDNSMCPDWMEKRAADIINGFSEALPYVEKFVGNYAIDCAGRANYPSGIIELNPKLDVMRWNMPALNGYGFFDNTFFDGTVRHEGHHLFYQSTVLYNNNPLFKDGDKDKLPGVDGNSMFEYLLDSSANVHGAYGPNLVDTIDNAIKYLGDDRPDPELGRWKTLYDVTLFDINNFYEYNQFDLHLPPRIPFKQDIMQLYVYIKVFPSTGIDNGSWYAARPGEDFSSSYTYDSADPNNYLKISVTLHLDLVQHLREMEQQGWKIGNSNKCLYWVKTPHHIMEYDASRVEPGEYQGWFPGMFGELP